MGKRLNADEYHAGLAVETRGARTEQAARLLRDLQTDARIVEALQRARQARPQPVDQTDTADRPRETAG